MDRDLLNNVCNKTFQANSGAIRFTMTVNSLPEDLEDPEINLFADDCPHEKLITISFHYNNSQTMWFKLDEETTICMRMPDSLLSIKSTEMWLSWYKDTFRMGFVKHEDFTEHQLLSNSLLTNRPAVGFITFRCSRFVNFDIKDPPVTVTNIYKQIDGGELRWVKMNSGDQLPMDALIGGYESEPIYIARAKHRGSVTPGKYVPSKQLAFIPWGHQEHSKRNFEILCGYNLMWIKCKSPYLPSNVYVAGQSEVHEGPLFIGRAMIDDDLVVGKVHMLYESCYLPYHGREIETNMYEVIACGNSDYCEHNWKRKCVMSNCEDLYHP